MADPGASLASSRAHLRVVRARALDDVGPRRVLRRARLGASPRRPTWPRGVGDVLAAKSLARGQWLRRRRRRVVLAERGRLRIASPDAPRITGKVGRMSVHTQIKLGSATALTARRHPPRPRRRYLRRAAPQHRRAPVLPQAPRRGCVPGGARAEARGGARRRQTRRAPQGARRRRRAAGVTRRRVQRLRLRRGRPPGDDARAQGAVRRGRPGDGANAPRGRPGRPRRARRLPRRVRLRLDRAGARGGGRDRPRVANARGTVVFSVTNDADSWIERASLEELAG